MELQISPLVLIPSCCLVGSRSIAARSLAVARSRRLHVTGRQSPLPPLPATAGSFARRPSVAAPLFSTAFRKLVGQTPTGYTRSLAPSKV
jgi:hypothetical protein